MPTKPPAYNAQQTKANKQQYEKERMATRHPGYGTDRWKKASKRFKATRVRCAMCDKISIKRVVDHIKPAIYFPDLFFDPNNWQVLCYPCNARKRATDEKQYGG